MRPDETLLHFRVFLMNTFSLPGHRSLSKKAQFRADLIEPARRGAKKKHRQRLVQPRRPLSLPLFLRCISTLRLNGTERFSAFQTATLASRSNQPAKWTHPLRSNFLGLRLHCLQQLLKEFPYRGQTSAERRTIGFHSICTFAALSAERRYSWTIQR